MRIVSYNNSLNPTNILSGFSEACLHLQAIFSQKVDVKSFGLQSKSSIDLAARKLWHMAAILSYGLPLVNLVVLMVMHKLENTIWASVKPSKAIKAFNSLNGAEFEKINQERYPTILAGMAHLISKNGHVAISDRGLTLKILEKLEIKLPENQLYTPISLVGLCGEHNLPENVKAVVFVKTSTGYIVRGVNEFLENVNAPQGFIPNGHPEITVKEGKILKKFIQEEINDPVLVALAQKACWKDDNTSIEEVNETLAMLQGEDFSTRINHPYTQRFYSNADIETVTAAAVHSILGKNDNKYEIVFKNKEGSIEKVDLRDYLNQEIEKKEQELIRQNPHLDFASVREQWAKYFLFEKIRLLPHVLALPKNQQEQEVVRLIACLPDANKQVLWDEMAKRFTHTKADRTTHVGLKSSEDYSAVTRLDLRGDLKASYHVGMKLVRNKDEDLEGTILASMTMDIQREPKMSTKLEYCIV